MISDLNENSRYLLDIIASVLNGCPAPSPEGHDMEKLYIASGKHRLTSLVYQGIYKQGLDEETLAPFVKIQRLEMRQSVLKDIEFARVSAELEAHGIEFCALKGRWTQGLYPDPSMRVMGDTDILIHTADSEAVRGIMEGMGYKCLRYEADEDDVYRRGELLYEYHRGLDSEGLGNPAFYDDPWRLTEPVSGMQRKLRDEDAYLYTAAHSMKHFMNLGTGLRTLTDIYLYMTRRELDRDYVEKTAREMGIEKFLACMERIAMAAFGGAELDEADTAVLRFMLESGIAGTDEKYEMAKLIRANGKQGVSKSKYFMRLLFPTAEEMKKRDPILKKAPVLLPFYYVRRWFQLVFSRRERLTEGLEKFGAVDKSEAGKLRDIYETAGIKR